ncbi:glycosyltransferase [Shimia litoralis]|nr:glycosyltransferase [Shimia litoralis]
MKRVLFHYPVLNVGGAEKSSLRMIKALCDRGWDVTLILTTGGGTLESEVDLRVKLVRLRPRAYGHRFTKARGAIAKMRALPDLFSYGAMRLIGGLRMLPFLFRRYDAAAVLLMGTPSGFVRKVVRARTRAIWIRSDLLGADPTGRVTKALRSAADGIDYFICVSDVSRRSLEQQVPEAGGKDVVVHNILDSAKMRSQADLEPAPFGQGPDGEVTILSVCRLNDRAKGLFRMARACSALKRNGHRFHWYIAGEGADRAALKAEIDALGIGDCMTLLGSLKNPFPAYRAADIVAMLSNYEGLCGVVNEARVLEKPVIATRVSGIDEQLTHGVNGLVVDQDEEAIVASLSQLITDKALREKLAKGGYPAALLDDSAKLDRLETLFLGNGSQHE